MVGKTRAAVQSALPIGRLLDDFFIVKMIGIISGKKVEGLTAFPLF